MTTYSMTERLALVGASLTRHLRYWNVREDAVTARIDRMSGCDLRIMLKGPDGRTDEVEFDGDAATPCGRKAIADMAFLAVHKELRERALTAAGHSACDMPAWSIRLDSLTAACLRHHGVSLDPMPRSDREMLARILASGLEASGTDISNGCLRIGEISNRNGGWTIRDYAHLELRIATSLPTTVLTGLQGWHPRLEDVVRLPFSTPGRATLAIYEVDVDRLAIRVPRRAASWEPIPAGVDRSWLRVPFPTYTEIPF